QIQWVESYVMDDRVYCVYIATNEELVREHAWQGGFPANRICKVLTMSDPTTPESPTPCTGLTPNRRSHRPVPAPSGQSFNLRVSARGAAATAASITDAPICETRAHPAR